MFGLHKSTKVLIFTLIFTLLCSGLSWAEEKNESTELTNTTQTTSSTVRTSFPDVPYGHWAQKHVMKLALQDIISGYEEHNGSFTYRPGNEVTQQEVIVLATKLMGLDKDIDSESDAALPFEVDGWAKPYVIRAIDHAIINLPEEIAAIQNSGSTVSWGKQPATREWVAKTVIRALGKKAQADALKDQTTDFTDDDKIAEETRGYVNAAVELKIVSGFNEGDFRPQGNVTRGQIAVFLSLADQYLEEHNDKVIIGHVMEVDKPDLKVLAEDGKTHTLTVHKDALLYTAEHNINQIPFEDIEKFFKVYVVQQNDNAYFVEILGEANIESYEGTVVDIDLSDLSLVLDVNGVEQTFELNPSISVVDENDNGLSLSKIIEDSLIVVNQNKLGDETEVFSILVKEIPFNKTAEGILQDISDTEFKIVDSGTTAVETYPISKDAVITYQGEVFKLENLNPKDSVSYEVKNGKVISIVLIKPIFTSERGTIEYIDSVRKTLQIRKSDKTLGAYDVSNSVTIQLTGMTTPKIDDLAVGDDVTINISDEFIVQKITVHNREIQVGAMATVISYESGVLTLKYDNGTYAAYELSKEVTIRFDGDNIPLDRFDNEFSNGSRVIVTSSKNELLSIEGAFEFRGKVTDISNTEISLLTEKGQELTFELEDSVYVEEYGRNSALLRDVNIGDDVEISYDDDQTLIERINIKKVMVLHVVDVDKSKNQVSLLNNANVITVVRLSNAIELTKNNQSAGINDFKVNEPIIATYMGKSIDGIHMDDVTRGEVTAVDVAGGTITVRTKEGTTTKTPKYGYVEVREGKDIAYNLQRIQVGDRIESIANTNDQHFVTILNPEERTFSSYNDETNEITFKKRVLGEETTFKLHADVYIHAGNSKLTANSLKSGDKLQVYFVGGQIVEVVRQ